MPKSEVNKVSFPVTVWIDPGTGRIEISRPTESGFRTSICENPGSAQGHPQLFRALMMALQGNCQGLAETPARYH